MNKPFHSISLTGTRAIATLRVKCIDGGNEEDALHAAHRMLAHRDLQDLVVDTGADDLGRNLWQVTYTYTR